jgi:hypothetical protein
MAAFSQNNTKSDDWYVKYYHIKLGNLRFHATRVHFRGITNTETKSDTIKMYNDWGQAMEMSLTRIPDHVTAEIIPETLEPGAEGIIAIAYDATAQGQFGPVFETMILSTNDTLLANKRIILSPDIQEDFSNWTEEELANAPKIAFESVTFDFDTAQQGSKVKHDFVFTNEGNSELIIRKVKSSCGCTATNPEKMNLQPGESSKIGIIFNTAGRKGKQHKSVTVIANDPEKSKTILRISGIIELPNE